MKLAQCGFLLLLIYPLESVRRYWNLEGGRPDLGTNIALFAIQSRAGGGSGDGAAGNAGVLRAARRMAMLLTLLFPSLMIDFGWNRLRRRASSRVLPQRSAADAARARRSARRVVWLLFDELDERIAFDLHLPEVSLPELERLRSESLVAESRGADRRLLPRWPCRRCFRA